MLTKLGDITQGDICLHHYEQFINKYEKYQRRCADPGKIKGYLAPEIPVSFSRGAKPPKF